MNRSFENIFEKYGINYKFSRKRHKNSNRFTHTDRNNQLYLCKGSLTQKSASADLISSGISNKLKCININTSCYFNTNTKRKYCNTTRCKTLDTVPVKNVQKQSKFSIGESLPLGENVNICDVEPCSKENYNGLATANAENINALNINRMGAIDDSFTNIVTDSPGCISKSTKNYLLDSFKISRSKQLCRNNVDNKSFRYRQLKVTPIHKTKNFNVSFEKQIKLNFVLHKSDHFLADTKDSRSLAKQPVENTPTELDLLIDLIKREEKTKMFEENEKIVNSYGNLPRTKSFLKGGYEELFQRALKHEKARSNFLKYDKKMGLRVGQLLTVVNVETSYGLTLATVKSDNLKKNFAIAVAQEMTPRLKLGAQIEAFFDDKILPYKMQLNGECIDIYLEPYKLLIV